MIQQFIDKAFSRGSLDVIARDNGIIDGYAEQEHRGIVRLAQSVKVEVDDLALAISDAGRADEHG